MELLEFAINYRERGYPRNANPWTGKVVVTDTSASAIVYAEGLFTVEEYLIFPNTVSPLHAHPVDTVTIFMGGEFHGIRFSGSDTSEASYGNADYGRIGGVLKAGDTHQATAHASGVVTLIVSKWNNIQEQVSAALNWYGPAIGPLHELLLKENGKTP